MTQDLIDGAEDFKFYHYHQDNEIMPYLAANGQDPKYFIISCIDSRCNPGTIFRAQPGIFFSHKAMGAIVRPYQQGTALAAGLQFAINHSTIDTVIVLGHTQCGAVKALAEKLEDPEITSFVNVAEHAHDRAETCATTPEEILNRTEEEVIIESMENLKQYPSVKAAYAENRIQLKTWQFDIKTGNLREYVEDTKTFKTLTTKNTAADSRK